MKKTLICMLLILGLTLGLLPVTALADTTAKIMLMGSLELSVSEGGAPVYTKNKAFDAANSYDGSSTFTAWTQEICDGSDWNVMFEWPAGGTPTVTLKDAKFDYYDNDTGTYAFIDKDGELVYTANRTTQDLDGSTAEGTDTNLLVAAIMPVKDCPIDLQIVLQGNNLIETGSGFVLANPAIKQNSFEAETDTYANTYFKNLEFVGEGENNTVANCDGIGIFNHSGYDVSFWDVNLTISTAATGTNAIPIHITNGNLTIDGGSINVTQSDRAGIWTTGSGDITINSGSVKATGSQGAGASNGVIRSAGMLIINGGSVKATPEKAVGLYGGTGIEISGGTVDIISPYYGINAGGEIVFNGGTTTITAQYAFYSANDLQIGPDVMAFAGTGLKKCEVYDGTNTKLSKKPWMLISDDESKYPEIEEEEEDVVVTLPTQSATVPTQATTDTPTSATQEPTENTRPSSSEVTRPTTTTATQEPTEETLAPTEESVAPTDVTEAPTQPSIKIEISDGGITKVPDSLKNAGIKTPEQVKNKLVEKIQTADSNIPAENIAHYDVTVDETSLPADGKITIVLPYPASTNASYTFVVVHMITSDAYGKSPGNIELPTVTNTAEGISFEVTGLSPISVGWTASVAAEPDATEATAATAPTAPAVTKAPESTGETKPESTKDKLNKKDSKDEEEDKDETTEPKKKGPNAVLIVVLVVVVLAGAGVAAWFAMKPKPTADEADEAEEVSETSEEKPEE